MILFTNSNHRPHYSIWNKIHYGSNRYSQIFERTELQKTRFNLGRIEKKTKFGKYLEMEMKMTFQMRNSVQVYTGLGEKTRNFCSTFVILKVFKARWRNSYEISHSSNKRTLIFNYILAPIKTNLQFKFSLVQQQMRRKNVRPQSNNLVSRISLVKGSHVISLIDNLEKSSTRSPYFQSIFILFLFFTI